MARSSLNTPDLPNLHGIAVIGGMTIPPAGAEMARLAGQAIIAAGRILVTGGRRGVGEAAAAGAAACCEDWGIDPLESVFSLIPPDETADFATGRALLAGGNKIERRLLLVQCTTGAIVIGGGSGTADEVLISVLQAIMNGYSLIPASGTGGVADRIYRKIGPFDEAILNDATPSAEKARVGRVGIATSTRYPPTKNGFLAEMCETLRRRECTGFGTPTSE